MILGMEIALTVMGLYMLCAGKTWGKNPVHHWQFRLMGGFLITLFPVMLIAAMILGGVYAISHLNMSPDVMADNLTWPLIGLQVGVLVVYGVIAVLWEKSIRRKASQVLAMPTAAFEPIPPAPAAPDHPMIPPNKTFGQS
jgi:hypothetical protein